MAYGSELPSRSPVGTKFVIEGRCGGEDQVQTISSYLEFPDECSLCCRRGQSPPCSQRKPPFWAAHASVVVAKPSRSMADDARASVGCNCLELSCDYAGVAASANGR
jgi:hypothetical protein